MAEPKLEGRLYVVEDDESVTIVRAKSPTSALKHVIKNSYTVRAATAEDVADYMSAGGSIEVDGQAGTEEDGAQPE